MSFREVCIVGKCNNLITLKNGNIELIFLDLGATIGRVTGRTKDAKVVLDGTTYYLEKKLPR